jgi:hypothetical protein
MRSNPERVVGRQEQISLGNTRYLSELVEELPVEAALDLA